MLCRLKVGKLQTKHTANDTARFSRLASLLSLVRGSSADNPDVDIQRTQRGVQNEDKRRLVQRQDTTAGNLVYTEQNVVILSVGHTQWSVGEFLKA